MLNSDYSNFDYILVPKALDFLDESFELVVTDESKRLFELGRPKQGYVGLVELPFENEFTPEGKRQAKIHLIPADNKDKCCMVLIKMVNAFRCYNLCKH
jgi:hypothetical protein